MGQPQRPVYNCDRPEIYHRFLKIVTEFKNGAIDTLGVFGRVSALFEQNSEMMQMLQRILTLGVSDRILGERRGEDIDMEAY